MIGSEPEDFAIWKMIKIRKPTYDKLSALMDDPELKGLWGGAPDRGRVIEMLMEIHQKVKDHGAHIQRSDPMLKYWIDIIWEEKTDGPTDETGNAGSNGERPSEPEGGSDKGI